jgi:hypothetical protein
MSSQMTATKNNSRQQNFFAILEEFLRCGGGTRLCRDENRRTRKEETTAKFPVSVWAAAKEDDSSV